MMHVVINAGEFHVSNRDVEITTFLGSCIAACLYDPLQGVVGMNHFLLSHPKYAVNAPISMVEAGRYGVHAMELVIDGMLKLGANRREIRAKVFGGSSFFNVSTEEQDLFCVGDNNTHFIKEFLKNGGIPLVAYDLGGDKGRSIRFSSRDYSVVARHSQNVMTKRFLKKERVIARNCRAQSGIPTFAHSPMT
ncbi:MAG: Chemoreceptor glutamine deamidase CheD [Syntrophus sp. SKADARSKE-3]|nr:Chemoreceptor glutamine deamidase CheD [Syntrophus sp. SKADARSKE-3]